MRQLIILILLLASLPAAKNVEADAPPNPSGSANAQHCNGEAHIQHRFANGAAWDLCWAVRVREGLVIEQLNYTSAAGKHLPVLASGQLAQLHVAYDDNAITYNDVTEFGLGGGRATELTEADCPHGELRYADERAVLCLNLALLPPEADAREHSHADDHHAHDDTTAEYGIELFAISQVGAYTYIVTWRLYADGRIQPIVGASGALQRASSATELPFGRVLAEDDNTLWLSHTHNYYWRLDFDLGDSGTDDHVTISDWRADDEGRVSRRTRVLDTEEALSVARSGQQDWHVWDHAVDDPSVSEARPQPWGYRLDTSGAGHDFERGDIEKWSLDDLYVTVARDCERFASQNTRFEPECADDVAAYVDGESLESADLVVWQRVSFHHIPRNEDRAHMHTHWDALSLLPVNVDDGSDTHLLASASTNANTLTRTSSSGSLDWMWLVWLSVLCVARSTLLQTGFTRRH